MLVKQTFITSKWNRPIIKLLNAKFATSNRTDSGVVVDVYMGYVPIAMINLFSLGVHFVVGGLLVLLSSVYQHLCAKCKDFRCI